jgi:hypothetical protein
MIQVVPAAAAQATRAKRQHGDMVYYRTEYIVPSVPIDTPEALEPLTQREPQAFIVEQLPGSVVGAHFHISNQFQVIVKGSGTLGRHPVAPISVHYSGGYTGYGPITAGEQGLAYLTLRAQYNAGPNYLPQSRPALKDVVRRLELVDDIHVSSAAELAARTTPVMEQAIAAEEGGLAAYVMRLGPGHSMTPDVPFAGGGQYWLVTAGEILHDGQALPAMSCVYLAAGEAPLTAHASAHGGEVLLLQFPREVEAMSRVAAGSGASAA